MGGGTLKKDTSNNNKKNERKERQDILEENISQILSDNFGVDTKGIQHRQA